LRYNRRYDKMSKKNSIKNKPESYRETIIALLKNGNITSREELVQAAIQRNPPTNIYNGVIRSLVKEGKVCIKETISQVA
jgi:hypothetical protein